MKPKQDLKYLHEALTILAPNSSRVPNAHSLRLVGSNPGSRNNVRVEVAVDVRSVARVGALNVAGDLGGRRRPAGAATSDLELSARDVELGRAAGVVDTELLDAKEVLSSGDLGGDGGGVGGWNGVSNGPGGY
jgi:hypothetical protein